VRIRAADSGDGWVLYSRDRTIGYIRGDTVGFIGFASEDHAARAACIAHHALARRRSEAPRSVPGEYLFGYTGEGRFVVARSGVLARLVPPEPLSGREDWGFEIELRPDESVSVFAMARARLMWNALRASSPAHGGTEVPSVASWRVPSYEQQFAPA
jgi:hypothetical protein